MSVFSITGVKKEGELCECGLSVRAHVCVCVCGYVTGSEIRHRVCVSHEDVGRRAAVCVCARARACMCVCVCVRARACGLCPAVTGSGRSVPSAPPEPVTRGGSGGPQHVFIVLFW